MNYIVLAMVGILISISPVFASTIICEGGVVNQKYLGIHVHRFHSPELFPGKYFKVWRLWDAGVRWADLEPSINEWDFRRLDLAVQIASEQGLDTFLTLGSTPYWAASDEHHKSVFGLGSASPPKNIEHWRRYIEIIVNRYAGKIKGYEIWNEPDTGEFYSGSVEKMVQLTNVAAEVIHEIDKNAILISPSPS